MSLVSSATRWWEHNVAWSNSPLAWRDRLVAVAFGLLAAALVYLSVLHLPLWLALVLWAGYAVALAVGSRQGWLKLFGPVLFYDMIRTARRNRYALARFLYGGLLLGVLCMMWFSMEAELRFQTNGNPGQTQRLTAMMAQAFFFTFMLVQLGIVLLLTPAYVAGAIAEEKERKTLEFLLATDLHNREIILSKFLSRLANMTLLLLTGLPILSVLQFIGGVDPDLMLAGFAGTGLTMLGVASVSILLSTLLKRPRDAIALTYLLIILYIFFGILAMALEQSRHYLMSWPTESSVTVQDVANVINAGNPLLAVIDIIMAIDGRNRALGITTLAAELPGLLERYTWFHLVLSLACIGWSIARVRAVALKQTVAGTTAKVSWLERRRPAVTEMPMLWKELHVENRARASWLGWIIAGLLILLSLGTGLYIVGDFSWEYVFGPNPGRRELAREMNVWFRIAGTVVGSLMLLIVAVRASTSITSERERDTFDALIASPLDGDGMLAAKLMGSLNSLRLGWLWLASLLFVGVCTGGLHVLAVPLVVTAWVIYSVFFAMVGLWYSMACTSSMRATVLTVLTTIGLGGGHWLITGMCCMPLFTMLHMHRADDFPEYLIKFQTGMTPPAVLAFCSYTGHDLEQQFGRRIFSEILPFCVVGLFLWVVGCFVMWFGMLVPKFRQVSRREEMLYE
jgi:ABC-type transport system involved in multi-copper enzyme maturation permease subunit